MDITDVTALFPDDYKRYIDCAQATCSAKSPCLQCVSHEVKHLYLDGKGAMVGGYPGWENKHFVNDSSHFLWDVYLKSIYIPVTGAKIFSSSVRKLNIFITFLFIAANIINWLLNNDISWFLLIFTIFISIWLDAKSTQARMNAINILKSANIGVQQEFRNSWLHQDLQGNCRCFKCGDFVEALPIKTDSDSAQQNLSDKEGACKGCGFIFWPKPIDGTFNKDSLLNIIKIPPYRPTFKRN